MCQVSCFYHKMHDFSLICWTNAPTRARDLFRNAPTRARDSFSQCSKSSGMVKRVCKEEDVGYVDLWDSLVGKEEMYARDGLHLSGKGAAVFAKGLSGAVASGLGKVRYLN